MKILLLFSTLLLAAATAHGQTPDPCATAPATCATLINTHATASTRLPNTVADISLSITVSGKDLLTVQHDLSTQSANLLTWLRTQRVERLKTQNVSFNPETKTQKNSTDKTVGYNGSEQITFRTTPEKSPELLGSAVDHGATAIDNTTFSPTEDEITAARKQLSAEATRSAIAQAEAVAAAASLHVVAVRNISVEASSPVFHPRARAATYEMKAMSAAAPVDTEAGDAAFTISVDVTAAATR